MNTEMTRPDDLLRAPTTSTGPAAHDRLALETAVDAILDDCFLSMGQAVGLRASFDYEAVVWIRTNFRARFLAAMRHFGNRWTQDRAAVTAVCGMLGERAVRYADGATSINLEAAMKASADVERYCQIHAARHSGDGRALKTEGATKLIAGYWCTLDPEP